MSGAEVFLEGGDGPTVVVGGKLTVPRGKRATVTVTAVLPAGLDQLVLEPSARIDPTSWTVNGTEWEAAIADALSQPCIVQEKVPIPSEPYPSWVDGRVHVLDRMLDTAPFISHGEYMEGMLTRLSTAALLNVTAGGGSTVPTLVVQPR